MLKNLADANSNVFVLYNLSPFLCHGNKEIVIIRKNNQTVLSHSAHSHLWKITNSNMATINQNIIKITIWCNKCNIQIAGVLMKVKCVTKQRYSEVLQCHRDDLACKSCPPEARKHVCNTFQVIMKCWSILQQCYLSK